MSVRTGSHHIRRALGEWERYASSTLIPAQLVVWLARAMLRLIVRQRWKFVVAAVTILMMIWLLIGAGYHEPSFQVIEYFRWPDTTNLRVLLLNESRRLDAIHSYETRMIGVDAFVIDQSVAAPLIAVRQSVYARRGLDCAAMFRTDEAGQVSRRLAAEHMATHDRDAVLPGDYLSATADCTAFRRMRGYPQRPMSKSEEQFPLAFSILLYADVQQLERLLRAVYAPQNVYCIHVDLKSPSVVLRAARAIASCFDNVFVASKLESVYWGHVSIMHAEMNCLADLVRYPDWRYFVNLSGQMFPAHSNAELVQILRLYDGANDVEGSLVHAFQLRFWFTLRQQFTWRLMQRFSMMMITPYLKNSPPFNVSIYKGSNQVALTRAFVLYFLQDPRSRELVEWFSDTLIPDEYIWPTLNHNPHLMAPGSYRGDADKKTSTTRASIWLAWSGQKAWSWEHWDCRGKFVHEVCIFGVGDLPWLHRRPELFVNKFHADYEWVAYDCMEELIFNRTVGLDRTTFDPAYYLNLTFVHDRSLVISLDESIRSLR